MEAWRVHEVKGSAFLMTRHPKPNFRHECENDARRAGACPGLAEASVGSTAVIRESGNPPSGTAVIWSAVIPAKAGIHSPGTAVIWSAVIPAKAGIHFGYYCQLESDTTSLRLAAVHENHVVGPGLAPAWPTQASALQSLWSGAARKERNSPKPAKQCGNVYENKRSAFRSPRQSCPGLADASVGPTIL